MIQLNLIWQKKSKIYTFCFYMLIVLMFSCKQKPVNTIRIGVLEGPSAISFIQMIHNQQLINNKKVEFIIKSDPQQIQALMMQNEVDFAILPTVMAANLFNKGIDFKLLACPIWGTLYILTNNNEIKILDDLQEVKISTFGQGATPDILLQRFIQYNKLGDVAIDYTYSNNKDISFALIQKKINLAVVSEPLVSQLLLKDSTVKIVTKLNCQDYLGIYDKDIFVQSAFLVSEKFIKNHEFDILPVCKAYSNSCNFINEQSLDAAKLLVKHNFLPDVQTAKISLPLCNIQYVGAFALKLEVTRYLNIFYEFEPASIGGKIPDRNFIYQPKN